MAWEPIITGVLAIFGALLKMWLDNAPARAKEAAADEKEKIREAIASGDAATLGAAIDGVPCPTSDSPRLGADEDTARRLSEITGG